MLTTRRILTFLQYFTVLAGRSRVYPHYSGGEPHSLVTLVQNLTLRYTRTRFGVFGCIWMFFGCFAVFLSVVTFYSLRNLRPCLNWLNFLSAQVTIVISFVVKRLPFYNQS